MIDPGWFLVGGIFLLPFVTAGSAIYFSGKYRAKLNKWKAAHQTPFPEKHIREIAEAMCKADGVNPMNGGWCYYESSARQFLAAQQTYRRIS